MVMVQMGCEHQHSSCCWPELNKLAALAAGKPGHVLIKNWNRLFAEYSDEMGTAATGVGLQVALSRVDANRACTDLYATLRAHVWEKAAQDVLLAGRHATVGSSGAPDVAVLISY